MDWVIVEQRWATGPFPVSWDLIRNGRFIVGDASEDLALQNAHALEATNWTYLDCCRLGFGPIEWVNEVQRHGWPRRDWNIDEHGGRTWFEGAIARAYGETVRFRYLILDPTLASEVRTLIAQAAPIRRKTLPVMPTSPAQKAGTAFRGPGSKSKEPEKRRGGNRPSGPEQLSLL